MSEACCRSVAESLPTLIFKIVDSVFWSTAAFSPADFWTGYGILNFIDCRSFYICNGFSAIAITYEVIFSVKCSESISIANTRFCCCVGKWTAVGGSDSFPTRIFCLSVNTIAVYCRILAPFNSNTTKNILKWTDYRRCKKCIWISVFVVVTYKFIVCP